jgi:hypothetical protein
MRMVDVFISYARSQRVLVEPLWRQLKSAGLDVFFDVEGIDGGDDFPLVIDRAIKDAKVVLGCWTNVAFARPWVLRECRVALARGVLVPVALEKIDTIGVPTEFFGINYFDLTDYLAGKKSEGWQRTIAALSDRLGHLIRFPASDLAREKARNASDQRHRQDRLLTYAGWSVASELFNGRRSLEELLEADLALLAKLANRIEDGDRTLSEDFPERVSEAHVARNKILIGLLRRKLSMDQVVPEMQAELIKYANASRQTWGAYSEPRANKSG